MSQFLSLALLLLTQSCCCSAPTAALPAVGPFQDLLESPHLTLELLSLMDMLPKNLDGVGWGLCWGKGGAGLQEVDNGCSSVPVSRSGRQQGNQAGAASKLHLCWGRGAAGNVLQQCPCWQQVLQAASESSCCCKHSPPGIVSSRLEGVTPMRNMLTCGNPCCCVGAQVCSNLAIRPTEGSSKDMSLQLGRLVSAVIQLRDVLRSLPVMADSMAWVDSMLLKVS